jgi:hypothetical protein
MKKINAYLISLMFICYSIMAEPLSVQQRQLQAELLESLITENFLDAQQQSQYQSKLSQIKRQQSYLGPGGSASISGNVMDTMAVAIDNHSMVLYKIEAGGQTLVDSTTTDASGNYGFTALAAGVYAVTAGNQLDDYLDYVWQDAAAGGPLLCSFCVFPAASQFNLAAGASKNNVDFSVTPGGSITGRMTDATTMAAVSSLSVNTAKTDGDNSYLLTATVMVATGEYSIKGIPDGDYRLYLKQSFQTVNNHIPQVYGGFECNFCFRLINDGIGTVISIAAANAASNIDFNLNTGASISGKVVDTTLLNALPNTSLVLLFDELNHNLAFFLIDGTSANPMADGSYTVGGLLAGSYYVQGGDFGRDLYQRELYANKPCYFSGCDRGADGDAVVLTAGEHRIGVNFLLDLGGKISGNILDQTTGLPISLPSFENQWVTFYDVNEAVIGAAIVKFDGSYLAARGMPAGDYAVRTGSMFNGELTQPYVNEKYNDIPCAGISCDLSSQDVNVVVGSVTTGIDFDLATGFAFSGTITDTATALPIANVNVLVYKDMGVGIEPKFANWATTSDGSITPIGTFVVTGLPAGTYYALTNNGSNLPFVGLFPKPGAGWVDILYDGITCPAAGCDISSGTPIILPATTRGMATTVVDIGLSQGASISGKVTNFADSAAIKQIEVEVYNQTGVFMGAYTTDINGTYRTAGFPAGSYFLITSSFDVLVDVKFGNLMCTPGDCNPLDALPIILLDREQKQNQDFILRSDFLNGHGFE